MAILSEPEAALWWGEADEESLRDDYLGESGDDHAFSVELEGELIGIVAYWEENEPDYRHAGMDITLAAPHRGRGLGQDSLADARPLPLLGARPLAAHDRP